MPQISFRVTDEVAQELERGRIAQHYSSAVEYVSALILSGAGRAHGLAEPTLFNSVATDARLGGAITTAIALMEQGNVPDAIDKLRFAQDIILDSLKTAKPTIEKRVSERLRVRGGSDVWTED